MSATVTVLGDPNSAAVAAVSVASLVIGYGMLAGLWFFVFSPKASRRREAREDAEAAARIAPDVAGGRGSAQKPEPLARARPRLPRRRG